MNVEELIRDYGTEFLQESDYYDQMPYEMDMLEEITNFSPLEAITRAFYGYQWSGVEKDNPAEFNPNDEYFAFNGYGNLISIPEYWYEEYLKSQIDEDDFIEWCKEQGYVDDEEDIEGCKGVGAVLWEYVLMECQNKGIDLSKDYFAQPDWVLRELREMRKKFGYRQSASSKAMGRSENQSFYYAICRHYDKA